MAYGFTESLFYTYFLFPFQIILVKQSNSVCSLEFYKVIFMYTVVALLEKVSY